MVARPPGEGRQRSRRWLFRLHAWAGLNLGLLLFVVCFSGTVAVFSPELSWLADPAFRAEPASAGERPISWEAMRRSMQAAQPLGKVVQLAAPRGERWPATAFVAFAPGDFRTYLLDPRTGDVRGRVGRYNLVAFFRIFHKQFYFVPPAKWMPHGTVIVGAFALVLLLSALTGLLSYRRWWRGFLQLRAGRSPRLLLSDLHRAAGVWALAVTLVIAVTGTWYMVEKVLEQTGAMQHVPDVSVPALDPPEPGADSRRPIDLDRAAALAKQAYPALDISLVSLPRRPDEPLVFMGQAEAWVVRRRANQVHMDPYTGRVFRVVRATEAALPERLLHTADPLHFGTFGGLASRIVWLLAGLAICTGIVTGLLGYWSRVQRAGTAGRGSRLGAVASVLPTVAVLAVSVYATLGFTAAQRDAAATSSDVLALGRTALGPWTVDVMRYGDDGHLVLFAGDRRPVLERADAWIGRTEDGARPTDLRVFDDRLFGRIPRPAACDGGDCRLFLRAWRGDGGVATASVPLTPPSQARHVALPTPPPDRAPPPGVLAVIGVFVLLCLVPAAGWIWLRLRAGGV